MYLKFSVSELNFMTGVLKAATILHYLLIIKLPLQYVIRQEQGYRANSWAQRVLDPRQGEPYTMLHFFFNFKLNKI